MLTETEIKTAKIGKSDYKLSDGRGLSLLVSAAGGKLWRFRYKFNGKDQLISLGHYPDVTLKMARDRLREAREKVAEGINPSAARKEEKRQVREDFSFVAETWLEKFYPTDSDNKARIVSRLAKYIYPTLGKQPMKTIATADVLRCLEFIAEEGRLDTAHRCMGELSRIWKWAVGRDLADKNIIDGLEGQLPDPQRRKHPGLTDPKKVGELLRDIDTYRGQPETRMCLQILPYLAARPTELREAVWEEFDLDAGEWRIPVDRMKEGKVHVVPLATQVIVRLRKLQVLSGTSGLLFPGLQRRNEAARNRPISNNTMNKALRKLGYDTRTEHCSHGFRTTFSTLMTDELGEDFHAVEMSLAHVTPGVAGVYKEATMIKARRPMMQRWADYLDKLRTLPLASHGRSPSTADRKSSMSASNQRTA